VNVHRVDGGERVHGPAEALYELAAFYRPRRGGNLNAAERLDSGRPWGRAHRAQYWCDVPRTSTMGKRRRLVGTVVGLGVILSAMIFALVQRRVQERLREALSRNAARRNALGNFLVLQLPSPRSRRWRNHLRLPDWSCRSPSRAGPSRASSSGCSGRADASSGMPGTSPGNLPKAT